MCYFVQYLVQVFLSMNTCYLTELFNPVWVRVGRMATLSQKLGMPTSRVSAVGKLQTSLILGHCSEGTAQGPVGWAGLGALGGFRPPAPAALQGRAGTESN